MNVQPIRMGVPVHTSLSINRNSLSAGWSTPVTGRMFGIRNSKGTSALIRMGYGGSYLPDRLTRKMTHMGTTPCVENRYNPATGFSTGKGSFRIIHLTCGPYEFKPRNLFLYNSQSSSGLSWRWIRRPCWRKPPRAAVRFVNVLTSINRARSYSTTRTG